MSGAVTGSLLAGQLVTAIAGAALMPKAKTPKVQAPEAPPATQASRLPDQATVRANAMSGANGVGTLLTGPGGVASGLNLGKNTLLGS